MTADVGSRAAILVLAAISLAGLPGCAGSRTAGACVVTYIANDGFLIDTGKHKVLIDALFGGMAGDWCDQPGDSLISLMTNGLRPFDNIDLVLVTHYHVDHFNGPMVAAFLENNRKAVLVCPSQVAEALKRADSAATFYDRVIALGAATRCDTVIGLPGIGVRAMRFDHSTYYCADSSTGRPCNIHADVENLGYLVRLEGITVFHSGDDSPQNENQYSAYGLGGDTIDVAFLDQSFATVRGLGLLKRHLKVRNLVYMHICTRNDKSSLTWENLPGVFPQVHVFVEPMQSIAFSR